MRANFVFRSLKEILLHPITPVISAFLWYLYGLGEPSLWADEGATFGIASLGLRPYEHPSLYFRFMEYWMRLFGTSEWSLRMPSALSASILPCLVFKITNRFFGPREAIYGAWLAVFSPFVRLGAQEARMYAPLAAFQAVAFLGLIRYLDGIKRGLVLWCACTVISTRLHHLGWLGCWPPFFIALLYQRQRRWAYGAGISVLVLYGSLWYDLYGQIMQRIGGGHLGSTPGVTAAMKKLAGQVYYLGAGFSFTQLDMGAVKDLMGGPWFPYFLVLLLLPLIILIRGFRSFHGIEIRWSIISLAFFLPTFLFIAYEGSPANLLLPVYTVYLIVMAAGSISRKRFVFGAILMLWISAGVIQSRTRGYPIHPEDWRGLTRQIQSLAIEGDAVYLTGSRNSHFTIDYYSLGDIPRYSAVDSTLFYAIYDPHRNRSGRSVAGTVREILQDHPRLWFVYIDYDMPFMERTLDTLRTEYVYDMWEFESGLSLFLIRSDK